MEETARVRHATYAGYVAGCRCPGCRDANAQYGRNYRACNLEKVRKIERESKRRTRARVQEQYAGVMSDG